MRTLPRALRGRRVRSLIQPPRQRSQILYLAGTIWIPRHGGTPQFSHWASAKVVPTRFGIRPQLLSLCKSSECTSYSFRFKPIPKVGRRRRGVLWKLRGVSNLADLLIDLICHHRRLIQNLHCVEDHDRTPVGAIHHVNPGAGLSPETSFLEDLSQKSFLERFPRPNLAPGQRPEFLTGSLANQENPRVGVLYPGHHRYLFARPKPFWFGLLWFELLLGHSQISTPRWSI